MRSQRTLVALALVVPGLLLVAWRLVDVGARAPRQAAPPSLVREPTPRVDPVAPPVAERRTTSVDAEVLEEGPTAQGGASTASAPDGEGLDVLVEDPRGDPVGYVPVVLLARAPTLPVPWMMDQVVSGRDGRARISTRSLRSSDPGAGVTFVLALDLDLEPPVEVPVLSEEVALDHVHRLVLPDGNEAAVKELEVLVLQTSGNPLEGVPVEYVGRQINGTYSEVVSRNRSDPRGWLGFPRHEERALRRKGRVRGMELAFHVQADVPSREPITAPVGVPGELVELRLPPLASLRVRAVHPDGRAVREGASALLWYRPLGSTDDVIFERARDWSLPLENGEVVFGPLGLGLELRVAVSLKDGSAEEGRLTFAGPETPGEHELVVTLGGMKPVLVGRLLDEDGRPFVRESLSLAFEPVVENYGNTVSGPRQKYWSHLSTDAEGRFSIPVLGGRGVEGGHYAEFLESAPRSGPPGGWIPRYVHAGLPNPLPVTGTIDLGELHLGPVPALVAGTVVDPGGVPVEGADVRLSWPLGEGNARRQYNLGRRIRTGADGVFAYHGLERVPAVCVAASGADGRLCELEVEPGSTGVRLVLATPPAVDERPLQGKLHGRVLLDEGLPTDGLEFHLRSEGRSSRSLENFGGAFGGTVHAGTWTLTVSSDDTKRPLYTSGPLEVEAERVLRLDPIDLRGVVRLLRLRFLLPGGLPLKKSWVWIGVPGGKSGSIRTDELGRAFALVRADDARHEVWTNDHARQEVDWSPGVQELVLVPR